MSYRCEHDKRGAVEVFLSFDRAALLYDIRNYTYIEGEVLGDDDYHRQHVVTDSGQAGNVDRLTRVMDLTVAGVVEMMYPYTKQELCRYGGAYNNELEQTETYVIVLSLPTTFSETTALYLEKLVHDYIVCNAVADWMSITNTPKAQVWEGKVENLRAEIKSSLNHRRQPLRRKAHPF